MSDTKHTPGPWKVYGTPGKWPGIDSDTMSIVIYGEDGNFERGIRGESNEEAFANARFIVRAVNSHYALLAAISMLLDSVDYTIGNCRVNDQIGAVLDRRIVANARAAISDAKGK